MKFKHGPFLNGRIFVEALFFYTGDLTTQILFTCQQKIFAGSVKGQAAVHIDFGEDTSLAMWISDILHGRKLTPKIYCITQHHKVGNSTKLLVHFDAGFVHRKTIRKRVNLNEDEGIKLAEKVHLSLMAGAVYEDTELATFFNRCFTSNHIGVGIVEFLGGNRSKIFVNMPVSGFETTLPSQLDGFSS